MTFRMWNAKCDIQHNFKSGCFAFNDSDKSECGHMYGDICSDAWKNYPCE